MTRLQRLPRLLATAMVLLGLAYRPSLSAPAGFCVHVPQSQWLSAREVEESLKEAGYTMLTLKVNENRCLAVTAKDLTGQSHALVLHPVSAKKMSGGATR